MIWIIELFVGDVFLVHILVKNLVNDDEVNQQEILHQLHWNINTHDNEAKIKNLKNKIFN
jgi:hypothetical protein